MTDSLINMVEQAPVNPVLTVNVSVTVSGSVVCYAWSIGWCERCAAGERSCTTGSPLH